MTDFAEGAETPERMAETAAVEAEMAEDIRNLEDRVAKLRAENLEHAKRVVLGAPCASWMQEGRTDA